MASKNTILTKNRLRDIEDIIASKGKTLVFIEVKTRTSDDFGSPSESIPATDLEAFIKKYTKKGLTRS